MEDLAEAAAVILMEGPEKHSGKDYFFSADALTPQQVAQSLTAATGRKFTAAVLDADTFLNETTQDDTKKIIGREPLLLGEWAKLHANELLEIAGG